MSEQLQPAGQIQSFDPATITINQKVAARKGKPVKADIERIMTNMLERRESGLFPHQITPGLVRVLEDGTVELIDGRHRLEAELGLNKSIEAAEDKFPFLAVAIPANDEQALIDAITRNEFVKNPTVFDRADSMGRLEGMGKTQEDIAKCYGVQPSMVSEILRCGKLPKKIKELHEKGGITEEGMFVLARYNKDPELQAELLAESQREREEREKMVARAEARAKGEPVEGEEAAGGAEEQEAEGGGEDKKDKKKSSAPKSDATKKRGKQTPKGRVTGGDVKKAVKKKGVQKREASGRKSRTDFVEFLNSSFGENATDVSEPIFDLAEKLESWFDGDIKDQALKNAFVKSCRTKYAS